MKSKDKNGFTLIEVLVAINLSFFALTIAISFYLFANKFITSFRTGYEEKEDTFNFIYRMDEVLRDQDGFRINYEAENKIDINGLRKEITIGDKFELGGLYNVDEIDSYEFRMKINKGREYFLMKSDDLYANNFPGDVGFSSQEIASFDLRFTQAGKIFTYHFVNPPFSSSRFINIEE